MGIILNIENSLIRKHEFEEYESKAKLAYEEINKSLDEPDSFLGWVRLPLDYDKEEYQRVKEAAAKIRSNSEALLVIGIGGSYLGALASIDALCGNFYNELDKENPNIYFAGNNMSETYIQEIYEILKDKDFSINVISKSGTTLESALSFRIFKDLLIDKYGEDNIKDRIFVTTDKESGALKEASNKIGYESFIIPDSIGGRFSVLTPVGILPMAVAGIDIDQLYAGAQSGYDDYFNEDFYNNDALIYAAARNILYSKGKDIEILANYTPELKNLGEWWKQLFGESEGKDHKGIFPASVSFTTDLHSLGQLIQDGRRNLFETIIYINSPRNDLQVPNEEENFDGLNYLAGKSIYEINESAFKGTLAAHVDGGVPNLIIEMDKLDEFHLGKILYFFMVAVAISGNILGVNQFNQPGVESYKSNMYKLLES